jgi:hypothetical protein
MVQPSSGAFGDEQTPPHDPWAPTQRVTPSVPPATPLPATRQYPPTTPYPYPYPGLTGDYAAPEAVILTIGEIQVTATTIRTPVGTFPLHGSQWQISDSWTTDSKIPAWAIVLAIVLFFCIAFFSLLFLLARQNVQRAVVTVTVRSGRQEYIARIPAPDQPQVQYLYQQVNYVRSLAAM